MNQAVSALPTPATEPMVDQRRTLAALLVWTLLVAAIGSFATDYRWRNYRETVRASGLARLAAVQDTLGIAFHQWAALPVNLTRRHGVREFVAACEEELRGTDAAAWQGRYAAHVDRPEVRAMSEDMAAISQDFGLPFVALIGAGGHLLAYAPQSDRAAAARADLRSRRYVRDALEHGNASQFVLGRVSGTPGMYFAARIEAQGQPVGVVALRQDAEVINRMLGDPRGHLVMLTDSNGVVAFANRPDWLLRRIDSAPEITAAAAADLYQRQPQALAWAAGPLRTTGAAGATAVAVDGVKHVVARADLAGQPLTVWVLAPLADEAAIGTRFAAGLGAIWLIGCGLLVFTQRRLQWARSALAAQHRAMALDASRRISDERFAAVYEHAASAYLFFTAREGIDQCNAAACRLFGAGSEAELIGRVLWYPPLSAEVQADARRSEEAARAQLAEHLRSRERLNTGSWRFRRLDGRAFDAEFTVIALEFEHPARFCAVLRDVTAQREAEAALLAAKASAQAESRAKSSFLANMSHELRTPMNAIIGMSHLALEDGLPPRQRGYVEKAHRAARALLGILNDLLDMSKIESGQLEMERIEFDVQTVVSEVADVLGQRADEKGLELVFRAGADLPRRLVGDPTRLRQVLVNLGGNAVKFTDVGAVTIGMDLHVQTDAEVTLHAWVHDTGSGIAPAQRTRLFQPFAQADSSTTRRYGGTGLGLVICRELVERMGGTIWLDSELDRGSTFHFTAVFGRGATAPPEVRPAAAAQPAEPPEPQRTQRRPELAGARVLVVEDNAINQELARELLERAGVRVTLAEDGAHAIERFERDGPFDAVLMDCQMPVMDGYAATRQLRARPAGATIPIIAMTASALAEDRRRALAVGMNAHLTKPLDVELMLATLASWITKHRHDAPPAAPASAPPEGSAETIDVAAGMARCLDQADLFNRLLRGFRHAQTGFVAGYRHALAEGRSEDAARALHDLTGLAGTIGAEPLRTAATALRRAEHTPGTERRDEALERLGQELNRVLGRIETLLAG